MFDPDSHDLHSAYDRLVANDADDDTCPELIRPDFTYYQCFIMGCINHSIPSSDSRSSNACINLSYVPLIQQLTAYPEHNAGDDLYAQLSTWCYKAAYFIPVIHSLTFTIKLLWHWGESDLASFKWMLLLRAWDIRRWVSQPLFVFTSVLRWLDSRCKKSEASFNRVLSPSLTFIIGLLDLIYWTYEAIVIDIHSALNNTVYHEDSCLNRLRGIKTEETTDQRLTQLDAWNQGACTSRIITAIRCMGMITNLLSCLIMVKFGPLAWGSTATLMTQVGSYTAAVPGFFSWLCSTKRHCDYCHATSHSQRVVSSDSDNSRDHQSSDSFSSAGTSFSWSTIP